MSNISRLEKAGFDLGGASKEQRDVLEKLSESELTSMLSVKSRLEESGPEVEGHTVHSGTGGATGGWCW